eukprot:2413450-Pyramimonas_sp.AAC.1
MICSCALGQAIARVVPAPSASLLPSRDCRVITSSAPTSLTVAMSSGTRKEGGGPAPRLLWWEPG